MPTAFRKAVGFESVEVFLESQLALHKGAVMYPWLPLHVPTYYAMWGVAAASALLVGRASSYRSGLPLGRSTVAIVLLAFLVLLGSKLLYVIESQIFPRDSVLAALPHSGDGFRLPGGVILSLLALPFLCVVLSLPWRQFGDKMIVVLLLAIVFIRIGCFLNGCCFGRPTDLPWGVRFPAGSFAFQFEVAHRMIYPIEPASLAVHPLQLYFAGAAALGALVLALLGHKWALPDGSLFFLGGVFFFASTAALELLRGSLLTLNVWLTPLAAGGCLVLLYMLGQRRGRPIRCQNSERVTTPGRE